MRSALVMFKMSWELPINNSYCELRGKYGRTATRRHNGPVENIDRAANTYTYIVGVGIDENSRH